MGALVLGVLQLRNTRGGLGAAFEQVSAGLSIQLGATIGGALAGVFPGMIVGTLVGLVRRRDLPVSPHLVPEGASPLLKGLLLPAAGLVALGYMYIEYLVPLLLEELG